MRLRPSGLGFSLELVQGGIGFGFSVWGFGFISLMRASVHADLKAFKQLPVAHGSFRINGTHSSKTVTPHHTGSSEIGSRISRNIDYYGIHGIISEVVAAAEEVALAVVVVVVVL